MPHRRPTCLWRHIGDWHACGVKSEFKHIYLNVLFAYLCWNNVRTLIRHVGLWTVFNYACRSPMCLRLGRYVGLWQGMLVFHKARESRMGLWSDIWSPIGHVGPSKGMPVSDELCRGLQSDMSFSDGSPIGFRYKLYCCDLVLSRYIKIDIKTTVLIIKCYKLKP